MPWHPGIAPGAGRCGIHAAAIVWQNAASLWQERRQEGPGGWQHLEDVSSEQIAGWARDWPDATNTGILTKHTPALDLDILDEEAARACEDLVRERFEEHGAVLVRIGKPPKRAILFRTTAPFSKILANVTAPNGAAEKIEFLGDGQQLVVAGIHPDTKQPYRWHGGEPGQIRRDELPLITADEARALVEDLVELLVRGLRLHPADEAQGRQQRAGQLRRRAGRISSTTFTPARRCTTASVQWPPG